MKFNLSFLIWFSLLFAAATQTSYAQIKGVSYQAVAIDENGQEVPGIDLSGQPIAQNQIAVRFSILSGSNSGSVLYQETQSTYTDQYGLFSLTIGEGAASASGSYQNILDVPWSATNQFLKVEIDIKNTGNFKLVSVQQFMAVPYALYALNAGNGSGAGSSTLIKTADEPSGANCGNGGIKIEYGIDANSNGILDVAEVNASLTNYVCNGTAGNTGNNGSNGFTTLIKSSPISAGLNCTAGGIKIESGLDINSNSILETSEITTTQYVCNGTNGAAGATGPTGATGSTGLAGTNGYNSLIVTTIEAAGSNCANGGQKIQTGLDVNGNGIFDGTETYTTKYVCNGTNGTNGAAGAAGPTGATGSTGLAGTNGHNSLVLTTAEAAGSNCSNGGQKIQTGLDVNGNGIFDGTETYTTKYVCNGTNGAAGAAGPTGATGSTGLAGTDGHNSLVLTTVEAAGVNCANGGQKIQTGLDVNGNGVFDGTETYTTKYVCNGTNGAAGATGPTGATGSTGLAGTNGHNSLVLTTTEAAGANCANGGFKMEYGLDVNSNGVLDAGEINAALTKYVCNGTNGSSGSGSGWSLTGNAGTVDGTNFIGTTDKIPLNFRVYNQKAGRIDTIGATLFGYKAGNKFMVNSSGSAITAIGFNALSNNTTGSYNTASGDHALYSNTTGGGNTANGDHALYNNTTGYGNTANGHSALNTNTTGYNNTANGLGALSLNTTGSENAANGVAALSHNTIGSTNTANGNSALYWNATGSENTAIGYLAMENNDSGNENTAIGTQALEGNLAGNNNTAIGYQAMPGNSGNNNTTVGSNTDVINGGNNATAVGASSSALADNSTVLGANAVARGINSTAIGANALVNTNNSMVLGGTGINAVNVGIGLTNPAQPLDVAGNVKFSGALMPNGSAGTANQVLTSAGPGLSPTWQNTSSTGSGWGLTGNAGTVDGTNFIGTTDNKPLNFRVNNQMAGRIDSISNVFLGYKAGYSNTTPDFATLQGIYNTSVGYNSLAYNITGHANTANGYQALLNNNGSGNTAIGTFASYHNITGNNNTVVGSSAFSSNNYGNSNTAFGSASLNGNQTGNNNTALGAGADVSNSNLSNTTAVGSNAKVSISNTMVFGNSSVVGWGFGTNPVGSAITVGFSASNGNGASLTLGGVWTNASDSTKKYNIRPISYGLKEVMKLRPVSYTMKGSNYQDIGFIAQEVKLVLPELVYGKEGEMTLSYGQMTSVLTKAIQEQQKEIEQQKAQNEQLQKQLLEMQKQIEVIQAQLKK